MKKHRSHVFRQTLFLLLTLHSFTAYCQSANATCNEQPGSWQQLFVCIAKLLYSEPVANEKWVNNAKYTASYAILRKICGDYNGDTIHFDFLQPLRDSSFKKSPIQLLMLLRDTTTGAPYQLWGGLHFPVQKSTKNEWYVTYTDELSVLYIGQQPIKRRKIKFSDESHVDVKGLSKEEIAIAFPEPYYKINKQRAIPVYGYAIEDVFQFEKEGALSSMDIFPSKEQHTLVSEGRITVDSIILEDVYPQVSDSLRQTFYQEYLALNDSLQKDPFNENLVGRLIKNCQQREDTIVCENYFDSLIIKYPDSANTYWLWARFRHQRVSIEDSSRFIPLKKAFDKDSTHRYANFALAISYYQLFLEKPNTYFASRARDHFARSINLAPEENKLLKYPIIQLSEYLKDTTNISRYRSIVFPIVVDSLGIPIEKSFNWYFPIEKFMLSNTKGTDGMYQDQFSAAKSTEYQLTWWSNTLRMFKEPILDARLKKDVYRFLWLRSFHEPIVITLQKNNRDVSILWKRIKYRDTSGSSYDISVVLKKIPRNKWQKFEKMLGSIDYYTMHSKDYRSNATDGATWILEASVNGTYQITERSGYIYPAYTRILEYLIQLTDLNLPEKEIY